MKNLLVLNTGSSSIKFSLFKDSVKIFSGKIERIGKQDAIISYNNNNSTKPIKDFKSAINSILKILDENKLNFDFIAHRIVHGGDLNKPSLIDKKVEAIIEKFSEFAPLHNPPELEVIKICKKFKKRQYAVFDTSFFASLPEKAKFYPIPYEIAKKHNIKKYGFHGISHKYVTGNIPGKTISLHLGSGCSISAVENNSPLDTSMGLTPLEGLMMGTRAGDIDPGVVIYLQKKKYDVNKILNFESGLKAFSNDNDFRYFLNNLDKPNIKLGFDIFIYRIIKYLGAYSAALNGLDNIIFTGTIGENSYIARQEICKNLKYLGVDIDENKNKENNEVISTDVSRVKVYVKKTDEEGEIAKEVYDLI